MRKSAIGTRISLILVSVSIIVVIIGCLADTIICQNVGYGILGSSIVSFVVMLSEYFTSKREALERYYLAGIETINLFSKCQYEHLTRLDFALAEIKWNYDIHKIVSCTIEDDFFTENYDLIEEICHLLGIPSEKLRDDSLITQFLEIFEKRDFQLRRVMNQYVVLCGHKKLELENAFGNIFFICDLNKKQKEIYGNIHNPIQSKYNDLQQCCAHIKRYLSNEIANSPVIYYYLDEAIKSLYDVQKNENNIIVYPEFADKILNALEKLRCDIYYEDYKKIDSKPISATGSCIGDYMDATSVQRKEG